MLHRQSKFKQTENQSMTVLSDPHERMLQVRRVSDPRACFPPMEEEAERILFGSSRPAMRLAYQSGWSCSPPCSRQTTLPPLLSDTDAGTPSHHEARAPWRCASSSCWPSALAAPPNFGHSLRTTLEQRPPCTTGAAAPRLPQQDSDATFRLCLNQ